MPDLVTSANVDTLMQAANFAAFRTSLFPATGVATALGVNVGSAGAFVVLNGALGTPSSGTLTSCTGLPLSTGLSGMGTSVAAALAISVGTAGAFVVLNGALGTPSSGTVTNLTGTAAINITGTVSGLTVTSSTGTLTIPNGVVLTGPVASGTASTLGNAEVITGLRTFTPTARSSGATPYFVITTPADTAQTASTESIGLSLTAGTRQWSTGALTLQRERVFSAPTFSFVGASTLTTAINVDIADPVAGTNATFTNAYALRAASLKVTGNAALDGTTTAGTINATALTATQIDISQPASDGLATGTVCNDFNCGFSSSAVGDLVYLDSSATWQKTDANATATFAGMLGIALEVKASGAALSVLLQGFMWAATPFPTFTVGGLVYISETAGAVTQTAPTTTDACTRVIGWAVHADKLWFNPSATYITHT